VTPPEAAPTPPTDTPTGTGAFRGPSSTNYVQSNLAIAGSGTSATSATAASGGTFAASALLAQTPTILPGLLTAATVQSPVPADRVYFSYSYLDRFQVVTGGALITPTPFGGVAAFTPTVRQPGFNLNVYYVGFEKTFLEGQASAYIQAPFLQATDNITGQAIDGIGNLNVGMKYVLLRDQQSGSALTGGMTVSTPTGHNTTFVTERLVSINTAPFSVAVTNFTSTTNPTYLQPWLAGLLTGERAFIQEYFGVIIPTDGSVSTFINNDVAVGFQLYRAQGRFLSSVTPIVDLQALLPINHIGSATGAATSINGLANPVAGASVAATPFPTINNNLSFSNQLFLTSGLQFGLGERALLATGVITPLAGPKAFNWGVTVGLNLFY
jgi:hypothetical protein